MDSDVSGKKLTTVDWWSNFASVHGDEVIEVSVTELLTFD